ncbi:MAG: two-component system, OmpR family, sensor histidine kinase KdpD [Pseudonocardiales bacterium]|nr:two-component system, OmpR family, sensor histidine kinase KdpD [Pseudonocardiales bacterium]
MTRRDGPDSPIEAAFVLPIGFFGMLLIGVVAAAADGGFDRSAVLVVTCLLVAVTAAIAEPLAAAPLAAIGWFTVAGFSRPPYGELHLTGTGLPAVVLAVVAGAAAGAGSLMRRLHDARGRYAVPLVGGGVTLEPVTTEPTRHSRAARPPGLSRVRLVVGLTMAAIMLPALTLVLTAARSHLALVDDLLLYLLVVIVVTLVGGFWPAVLAALTAGLLLNWYFTPPVHNWTIEAPENMFALLLFVASAVTVSSVVHLAARRDAIATQRSAEAATLLTMARTVLGGDDAPQAVLDHLTETLGLTAELQELSGGRWVRVAGTTGDAETHVIPAGADLRLLVYGDLSSVSIRVLDGFAAQAAAAFERHRLRIQAGQAEALAAGNRMRTALLAAVSHDLRSPLASVKAAVGSLRQTDVQFTEQDRASLLATIEEGADRLDSLIGNLLDMSRIHTGALQPFVRSIALDEVAPLVTRGLDGGDRLRFSIPDTLPLVATDPGLLERALANLVANALRYSPPDRPPTLAATASPDADKVAVLVIDHGPGIAPDQRLRVFEPFQQLGDRRTGGGVGLGLAVAKGFIESVGGRIGAESTPGGGLTMRVELPATAPAPHAASAHP